MKYHDNKVIISVGGSIRMVRGTYTVESFSVTNGQDPEHKIYHGLVADFGSNGEMSFQVGRKGSDEVANWFNEQIPTSKTTFNHSAGKLNFAFIGTLKITVTGDIFGDSEQTFEFSKVAIAQGHTGGSNNWWFGGENCSHTQGDQVICNGTNSKGGLVSLIVKRGGNGVNRIDISPPSITYRDNDVILSISDNYSMVRGSFKIENFSVTNGQDPYGQIYSGLVVSFGKDGEMSFQVGRKGSDEVADWFNKQVPESKTTFNHSAGKLNFAFIGALEITVTGGIFGDSEETFEFSRVAIAQGHAGGRNNWWFGGQYCSYTQDNQVTCDWVNSSGGKFIFLRGGNGVNTIGVTPPGTADWMSCIADSLTLDQLMMPGSHDAGMSELHHCNPWKLADPYTQTQSGSIEQQLLDGSRYFDIRVDYDHEELVTYHRNGAHGCNGQSLKDVLSQTKSFLTNHKTETVILKFSHIRNYEDHHSASTKEKIENFLDAYSDFFYANSESDTNLAKAKLGDVRGKIVMVFDYSDHINPSKGRFRYKDGSSIQSRVNITVFDNYSETPDYQSMKSDQLKKWENHAAGLGKGYFFLLSWTLTSNSPPSMPSIRSLADEANSHLAQVLEKQIAEDGFKKPNIVYIDFVDRILCRDIILYNFGSNDHQEKNNSDGKDEL